MLINTYRGSFAGIHVVHRAAHILPRYAVRQASIPMALMPYGRMASLVQGRFHSHMTSTPPRAPEDGQTSTGEKKQHKLGDFVDSSNIRVAEK